MNDLHRLDGFHDLTLPEWGPYSKKYFGISHLADRENGMRFDFTVAPAIYRRQLGVPDALRPSGYLPWDVSADLEDYSCRQQLESKDRIYADVRFARITDRVRLVECRCVNNSELAAAFGVHLLSSLEAPPEKRVVPVLPEGVVWLDSLDHAGLLRAKMRPQDNLVYDGLRRGELRISGTVRGGCIEWGEEAGDRLRFRLPSPVAGPTRRSAAASRPGKRLNFSSTALRPRLREPESGSWSRRNFPPSKPGSLSLFQPAAPRGGLTASPSAPGPRRALSFRRR